ncbi:hypothetical protein EJB05_57450, partial [Eragrostis curvula]
MASGVVLDADEGSFEEYRDLAMIDFFTDGIVDLRAIVCDENTVAISWVFGIAAELITYCTGRIIHCDACAYETGFRELHVVLDKTKDALILPAITPAEHYRVIVHPLASGQEYDAYLQESREAFRGHRVFGLTGMAAANDSTGIDYCIRIADELKRTENAIQIVCSGWVFGLRQYAVDLVMIHPDTAMADVLPGWSRNWNYHSRCKLLRRPLVLWR